ncbi:uncharacterized protein EV420DRAFT_1655695 [Desarmillaria tabescens]|uniref:Uncharacterized protein n=1 Tax=Armillaria tabescens TaxID=1929756 RepID=A0AA39MFJ7_ARMTA|nr:uncharacterized protein EV420DRAFT_1655695 [Desarmillaria tabescens]KAK0432407.1 hypothetical protein EV420DRAFT_1655695 [Desarmillaria tabescens]
MKISINVYMVIKFIKELSVNPLAETPASHAFLEAVANAMQEQDQVPETCSKKRKHGAAKEGEGVYEVEQSTSLLKWKKSRMDCRNAEAKDVMVPPRKISMEGHPLKQKALQVVHQKSEMTQHSQTRGGDAIRNIPNAVEEPYMGHKPVWDSNGMPPPPMLLVMRCLAMMTTVTQPDNLQRLAQLISNTIKIETTKNTFKDEIKVDSLKGINTVLDIMDGKEAMHDFLQLKSHKLTLLRIKKEHKKTNDGKTISMEEIAQDYGLEVNTMKNQYKAGTRALYLTAGGGMWILPIIAILHLKARIIYYLSDGNEVRGTTNEDISGLAFALRDPTDEDLVWLVQTIVQVSQLLSKCYADQESSILSLHAGGKSVPFSDLEEMDAILDNICISYFRFPNRQERIWGKIYEDINKPNVTPGTQMDSSSMSKRNKLEMNSVQEPFSEITICLLITLEKTSCPINSQNREKWMEKERERALEAKTLVGQEESYQEQVEDFYKGETKPRNKYLLIDSSKMKSDVAHILDTKNKPVVSTTN